MPRRVCKLMTKTKAKKSRCCSSIGSLDIAHNGGASCGTCLARSEQKNLDAIPHPITILASLNGRRPLYRSVHARIRRSVALARPQSVRAAAGELQSELQELQLQFPEQQRSAILVYEGWDDSGKRRQHQACTQRLDPRLFSVYGIAKPTQDQLDHHYLWRFWTKLPVRGNMVIFDRSWYGRVLVERVEGFASEDEWRRAYDEITHSRKC